ncbi:unnamed protein product [Candida verbasci]|uniref:Trehalase n=1 Tax=Candida verbasci TaxID=1227364 RepID=A0A9W4TP89_9ASCO|nr:unnamed protein product [Candida verbasci]
MSQHSPKNHQRNLSNSSEDDPFDIAENYYGDINLKKIANKNSPLNRVRTFSAFETKTTRQDFIRKLNEQHPIPNSIPEGSEPTSSIASSASPTPPIDDNVPRVQFSLNLGKTKQQVAFHSDDEESPDEEDSTEADPLHSANRVGDYHPIPTPIQSCADDTQTVIPHPKSFKGDADSLTKRPSIVPIYQNSASKLTQLSTSTSQDSVNSISSDKFHFRRASVDDSNIRPKKFYIPDVQATLKELLENEDTDNNCQITIEDTGPKVLRLGTANSLGFNQKSVRGTYMLSNLLQELTIASRFGRHQILLDEARLNENPLNRMKRLISTQFWRNLTRRITKDNIIEMSKDTKIKDEIKNEKGQVIDLVESHRIYVPHNRLDQYEYFKTIQQQNKDINLEVQLLPEIIDADYIMSINKKPGLLSIATKPDPNDPKNLISWPYVVPGGRFNELYGWDSYMETLGLLTDISHDKNLGHLELARGMAENFIYEINHYGKILNANRSYYLGRSQPPFLTDMAIRIFNKTNEVLPDDKLDSLDFLKRSTIAAIKEYETIWCAKPRLDEKTGLSCYHPEGKGIPPETESTHFNAVLEKYVAKYQISQDEFIEKYNSGTIIEPDLDIYFLHDRAVRESGHDTSYRLEGKCAWLATVDLNSLLYKYENDITYILETHFDNKLEFNGRTHTSQIWKERAKARKIAVDKYLWNEQDSIYYDYNVHDQEQTDYESATTFWPLYAKLSSAEQASKMIENTLSKFEEHGGLASGTLKSRGDIGLTRPSRQWDYPFGWAPQQILAWIGLDNYGYNNIAKRLAYRWLFMMTKSFVDYNGVVVEKYNVTKGAVPHKVDAEYGNQGLDFKGVATEGFGWVNASYVFGLTFLSLYAQRALGTLTPPKIFMRNMSPDQRKTFECNDK